MYEEHFKAIAQLRRLSRKVRDKVLPLASPPDLPEDELQELEFQTEKYERRITGWLSNRTNRRRAALNRILAGLAVASEGHEKDPEKILLGINAICWSAGLAAIQYQEAQKSWREIQERRLEFYRERVKPRLKTLQSVSNRLKLGEDLATHMADLRSLDPRHRTLPKNFDRRILYDAGVAISYILDDLPGLQDDSCLVAHRILKLYHPGLWAGNSEHIRRRKRLLRHKN